VSQVVVELRQRQPVDLRGKPAYDPWTSLAYK
jgi:hypothetical protein